METILFILYEEKLFVCNVSTILYRLLQMETIYQFTFFAVGDKVL